MKKIMNGIFGWALRVMAVVGILYLMMIYVIH